MKGKWLLASILLVGCTSTGEEAESTAKSLYVAPNGTDKNTGTLKHPLKTVRQATKKATAGTTVYLRKGTYHEALNVTQSGTKQHPIIFRNYKQERVVLSGKNIKDRDATLPIIQIKDRQYVTIQGLTIEAVQSKRSDATPIGILVTGSGSHITLKNNTVRHIKTLAKEGNAHGIAVYGSGAIRHLTISGNRVEQNRLGFSEAFVLNGNVKHFRVTKNILRNNDNIGIDLIGYEGIARSKKDDYVREGVVSENRVYRTSSYGNPAYGKEYNAAGIYVDGGKNLTIEKNLVEASDIGIEVTSEHAGRYAEDVIVRQNDIRQNVYTGIAIGGYDTKRGGTKRVRIEQNQLIGNDTKGLEGGQLLVQHDVRDNTIIRNTFDGPLSVAHYFKTSSGNQFEKNTFNHTKRFMWRDASYKTEQSFLKAVRKGE
ncbi:right-handed parallel beta-helix repeat-containing protein [Exiguobacterium acetylicum]|uniref:right-handed parallel beta-helix repeat-containing protein n=1 Tax=Exiguobacterium acetylicum TaxID=41170 RepID=UPI0027DF7438|nr:right-handed parallel beta-helix repeat-containing protein [Exiguobacterium acetylicum]MDQ6466841.1 right-handed parallel beta-helix repeat-containing protein [Exiguobacterium acetylicum]